MVHEHVRWFGAEIRTEVTVEEVADPVDMAMRGGAFDDELRAEQERLRREARAVRRELHETRTELRTAQTEADAAKADAVRARASLATVDEFKRTRRYRAARALAAPIDALRRRRTS